MAGNRVTIYTDGSCKARRGGWAALILSPGERRVMSGKASETTNNRMELTAAINSLESLPQGSEPVVHSDSEYLIKTMSQGWRRNANLDLWQRLDALANEHRIQWEWVKGHNGDPGNEFVNALAEHEAGVRNDRPRLERYLSTRTEEEPPQSVPTRLDEQGGDQTIKPAPPVQEDHTVAIPSNHNLPPARAHELTHLDDQGRVRMVDVGAKPVTEREAVARGHVSVQPETLRLIQQGLMKKGDVLTVAQLAGIMGAKRTAELIPLCHPLPLNQVTVELALDGEQSRITISATARTSAKTGVEMEALTAVSVAALTVYDMCKAVDRDMRIEGIRLVRKRGGQSGDVDAE